MVEENEQKNAAAYAQMLYLLKQLYHTTTEVSEQNRFSRSVHDYMEAVSNDTNFKLTGSAKAIID
jgi:hypothetical protein